MKPTKLTLVDYLSSQPGYELKNEGNILIRPDTKNPVVGKYEDKKWSLSPTEREIILYTLHEGSGLTGLLYRRNVD